MFCWELLPGRLTVTLEVQPWIVPPRIKSWTRCWLFFCGCWISTDFLALFSSGDANVEWMEDEAAVIPVLSATARDRCWWICRKAAWIHKVSNRVRHRFWISGMWECCLTLNTEPFSLPYTACTINFRKLSLSCSSSPFLFQITIKPFSHRTLENSLSPIAILSIGNPGSLCVTWHNMGKYREHMRRKKSMKPTMRWLVVLQSKVAPLYYEGKVKKTIFSPKPCGRY